MGLRIGLHHGPALAVNSNERLDYFGRTVNIAARLSGAAESGEIVFSGAVWEHGSVRQTVCGSGAQVSKFSMALRGVEEVFELVRVEI